MKWYFTPLFLLFPSLLFATPQQQFQDKIQESIRVIEVYSGKAALGECLNKAQPASDARKIKNEMKRLKIQAAVGKKPGKMCRDFPTKQKCQECCASVCPSWNPACYWLCDTVDCETKNDR